MSRGAGAGRPSSLSWGAAWGEGMSRPQQPTTNDPLLPAGWEGQPARHPVTAGRPRQRRPQENPSPQPPGVYSQQRLFGVQTLAYLHREGGAGRARAGSLKSKTSGGGPGQATGAAAEHPGSWVHTRGRVCPASSAGPPAPQPGLGGGGRSFTPCPFIRSRRPDSRPRRTAGSAHAPGPLAAPPLSLPKQPTQTARWGSRDGPEPGAPDRVQTHLRLAIRAATKDPRGGTGCLRPGQRRGGELSAV